MSDASNPHINVLVVDNKKLGNNVHYACSTRNTHILRMTDDESFTENVNGFFYGICFGDHVRLQCLCVLQCGTYFKVAFVTAHEKLFFFPFFLRLVVCTRQIQSATASQKRR